MEDENELQKFLLKIMDIAEEDGIPCIALADEDGTIIGVMVGEGEFIDYFSEELPKNRSKKVH